MKQPFNLEAAKAGHPPATRDGRPAQFLYHAPQASSETERVGALVTEPGGQVNLATYTERGQFYGEGCARAGNDLFLGLPTKEVEKFVITCYSMGAAGDHPQAVRQRGGGGPNLHRRALVRQPRPQRAVHGRAGPRQGEDLTAPTNTDAREPRRVRREQSHG